LAIVDRVAIRQDLDVVATPPNASSAGGDELVRVIIKAARQALHAGVNVLPNACARVAGMRPRARKSLARILLAEATSPIRLAANPDHRVGPIGEADELRRPILIVLVQIEAHPLNLSDVWVSGRHFDVDVFPVALMFIQEVVIWVEEIVLNDYVRAV
jgi:hypothetical protein